MYGRFDENGQLVYWTDGYVLIEKKVLGKVRLIRCYNPSEETLNEHGWYRVVNVSEDGTDYYSAEDNCIYHYIGAPIVEEPEPEVEESQEV